MNIDNIQLFVDGEWVDLSNYVDPYDITNVPPRMFTGRTDINGESVYEGQTIKYQHSKNSTQYEGKVEWNPAFSAFWLKTSNDSGFALLGQQAIIEII
jgi:hypothetical protein